MRKRWFACTTILILCYSLSLEINTTYGEQRISLVRPVEAQYPISQPFGPSSDQTLQKAYMKWGYNGHFGIDYSCPVGTNIFVCDDGEVFEVNNSNPKHPNGLYLRIKHKWGSSVYCHLSSVAVLNGKRVAKNSVIGSSGKTGYVTGAHLHFGLRISGISNPGYKDYINPQKYASFESPVTQLSTSKIKEQKKSPEVAKSPEYSQKTLRLRGRIKLHKERIDNIGDRLLSAVPNPPPIEFKLTASEKVNAWADGRITMGLMDFLYSNPAGNPDDQLALILAHEIAHVKLNHGQLYKMVYEDFKGVVLGEHYYKKFTRDQEMAADFFGLLFAHRAGYDIKESIKFFKPRKGGKILAFWENHTGTHPSHNKRYEALIKEFENIEKMENAEIQENQLASKLERTPGKVTIEDGLIKQKGSYKIYLLIDGKKYLIPDRTTLNSLNFGRQSVRALTSDVFNSIPEGNPEEAKEVFALRKKGKPLTTQEVQKLTSVDQRLYDLKMQKAGKKVQKLPSTEKFKVPHIYTKNTNKAKEPSTESNFVISEVYKKDKGYYSQNMQSYYQGLDDSASRYEIENGIKELEIYEKLFTEDWSGRSDEFWGLYGELHEIGMDRMLKNISLSKKQLKQQLMQPRSNKGYYSQNMPSYYQGLNGSASRYEIENGIKELEIYEKLFTEDWSGRSDEFWRLYGELGDLNMAGILRGISSSKQQLKQQLMQPRSVPRYNQSIPYQTTPMRTNQNKGKSDKYAAGLEMITKKDKEKNTGYTDGLDRIKNNSISDSNTQRRTEGVMKVLEAFERWQTDYYMEETKRLAVNKKYFTAVNAMNLKGKGKGIDKVWDSILYAADNNDIVGLEKAIEVYKDLIKSELRIIKNQKITHDRP